jgi:hypothetical protein
VITGAIMPGAFVEALAQATIGETWNFYREGEGADLRRHRLVDYLERRRSAPYLLVGEAPGYRGTCVSGVPFTSERQLTGAGPGEATATIVHRVLDMLGLEESVLCWNVVPTHPHRPGELASNRAPSHAEMDAGAPFLEVLARGRDVIPVGRVAEARLGRPGLRHPAHGGAARFEAGLRRLFAGACYTSPPADWVRRFSVT